MFTRFLVCILIVSNLSFSASQEIGFLQVTLPVQPAAVSKDTLSVEIRQNKQTILYHIEQHWDTTQEFELTQGQYQVWSPDQKTSSSNCSTTYYECRTGEIFKEGNVVVYSNETTRLCYEEGDYCGKGYNLPAYAVVLICVGVLSFIGLVFYILKRFGPPNNQRSYNNVGGENAESA